MTTRRLLVLLLASAAAIGGGLAGSSSAGARETAAPAAGGIDPRAGGLEIALGEWAISPEARAIRPGPVTLVIRNRGTFRHGLELEIRRVDDRDHDHDDHGDDDAKSIKLAPGQVTRLTLTLAPGVYEIECFISHHDERGMRGMLEVRADAPLLAPPKPAAGTTVAIAGFTYKPATLRTTVGKVVTWRNDDAAPHTASAAGFSSPQLAKGGTYRRRFSRAGTYAYVCALHPGMRGKVIVAAGGGS
jgi:plastocyanin